MASHWKSFAASAALLLLIISLSTADDQVRLLREEVESLRREIKKLKNLEVRVEWSEAGLTETRGQLAELGAALHKLSTLPQLVNRLQAQIDTQKAEETNRIDVINSQPLPLFKKDRVEENEVTEKSIETRLRHGGRGLRRRVETLEAVLLNPGPKSILTRLKKVEGESSGVHKSVLELLESIESVETRVETSLPPLQRELSSADISLAKTMQQQAILKEEQENQRVTVKALSVGLSTMQDKIDKISHHKDCHNSTSKEDLVGGLGQVVQQYEKLVSHLPHACERGMDGVEAIRAGGFGDPIMVYCQDQWMVVQRRKDGSVDFNKSWQEYAHGFGSPSGEFWIGNEALHRLTAERKMRLRIDMVDIYGKRWWAEYGDFKIGSREEGFKLQVSEYRGNASDALDYQNGSQFSAKDSDRDSSNTHCAENYEGGWWFSHCQHANLNGRYNLGLSWFHAANNEWIAVARSTMSLSPSPDTLLPNQ